WLRLAAEAGLRTVPEAFADRAYTPEATLVPRRRSGAVLHDAEAIAERALRLARGEEIEASDGSPLRVDAASLCVHGDTPGAVAIARAVRERLSAGGVTVRAFAG
ncbi:LamB/YcsF family protein, partial [Streptomyces sp. NEAU-H3]|uniref:LamB/YcsF family protein n=1 Tax=Streptomyces sp. NEAU-H3 TaxID=2720636 RepID=UPI001438AB43